MLLFSLIYFPVLAGDWLSFGSEDVDVNTIKPYNYAGLKLSFDFEEKRLRCRGVPLYWKPKQISPKEWDRLFKKLAVVKDIDPKYCSDKLRQRSYYARLRDRDNACFSIFKSRHGDIPLRKVKEGYCRVSGSLDQLKMSSALRNYYREEMKKTCDQLEFCLGTLNENNLQNINDVVNAINHHLQTNIDAEIEVVSLNDAEAINEMRERTEVIREVIEDCHKEFPDVDQLLANDLSYLAKTLERDISVFHWFPAEKALMFRYGHKSPESRKSRIYANYMQGMFFDETSTQDRVGQGLYAVGDPNTTEGYGDKLLKIDLPLGAKYLDLRNSADGFTISEGTMLALKDAGCDGFKELDRDVIFEQSRGKVKLYSGKKSNLYQNKECREIFNRVIKEEGYQFLSYSFVQVKVGFCDDKEMQQTAFVLIDAPLTEETVDIYDRRFKEEGLFFPPSNEEVEKYRRLSVLKSNLKLDRNLSSEEKKKYQDYWKSRIYGCDKRFNDDPAINKP